MAGGGGNKNRFQYCSDSSGTILYFPSSSRSFRTQSYWSFITVQCRDSGPFLYEHLSRRMCSQFTFHHQFRMDTGRSIDIKLAQKKGLKFYQTPIERHHPSRNTPSLIASRKLFGWELRSCSTTRKRSCSTKRKIPINRTKSKSKSS